MKGRQGYNVAAVALAGEHAGRIRAIPAKREVCRMPLQETDFRLEDGLVTFTVFTATYNRAHLLSRVYNSLRQQTFRDFEWLVVDDGSTDDTRTVVETLQREADFPIRYIYQENGHKKTAFNRGVKEAKGDLFLPLDHDDEATPHALEIFHRHWITIPDDLRSKFTGVCGLCINEKGQIIGDSFPSDVFGQ